MLEKLLVHKITHTSIRATKLSTGNKITLKERPPDDLYELFTVEAEIDNEEEWKPEEKEQYV